MMMEESKQCNQREYLVLCARVVSYCSKLILFWCKLDYWIFYFCLM